MHSELGVRDEPTMARRSSDYYLSTRPSRSFNDEQSVIKILLQRQSPLMQQIIHFQQTYGRKKSSKPSNSRRDGTSMRKRKFIARAAAALCRNIKREDLECRKCNNSQHNEPKHAKRSSECYLGSQHRSRQDPLKGCGCKQC